MKEKSKIALVVVLGLIVLVFMAWIAGRRAEKLGLIGNTAVPSQESPKDGAVTGALPVLQDHMPEFKGITAWLNSAPLTSESLKGKVVLIDFWTYSCINCIRTLPYVTAWHEKYHDKGLVIIGVHTPEFAFEKEQSNVEKAIRDHAIHYPVAMDNNYATWDAYNNQYWPAEYLFDSKGRLRHTHFGEGQYDETESAIRALLEEAGNDVAKAPVTDITSTTLFSRINSPETYIGYSRQEYFASKVDVGRDKPREYAFPGVVTINRFSLAGTWKIESERAVLQKAVGSIFYYYDASNANLVMGGGGNTVRAVVTLDGKPVPKEFRGGDIIESEGKTYVDVRDERLYSLIDGKGNYGEHKLQVDFLSPGVECYAFTFG